jgi:hypothetical protein
MEVLQFILAICSALVAANFLVAGVRMMLGSHNAYEMNRQASDGPLRAMSGNTKTDDIDGMVRVIHGIAFTMDKRTKKVTIEPQSSLSNESLLETLRH